MGSGNSHIKNQPKRSENIDLFGKPYGLAFSILRPSKIPIALVALKEDDVYDITKKPSGYVILYDATTGLVKDILI